MISLNSLVSLDEYSLSEACAGFAIGYLLGDGTTHPGTWR